jgi:hypothetical protein
MRRFGRGGLCTEEWDGFMKENVHSDLLDAGLQFDLYVHT